MSISYSQLEELLKRLPAQNYPAAWDALSRLLQAGSYSWPAPPPAVWPQAPGPQVVYVPAPVPAAAPADPPAKPPGKSKPLDSALQGKIVNEDDDYGASELCAKT